jgi:hypothetical protein
MTAPAFATTRRRAVSAVELMPLAMITAMPSQPTSGMRSPKNATPSADAKTTAENCRFATTSVWPL